MHAAEILTGSAKRPSGALLRGDHAARIAKPDEGNQAAAGRDERRDSERDLK
jgi:hypothetical protein